VLELFILICSLIGNSVLGYITYRANPQSQTNRLFASLVGVTVLWLITTYLALQVPEYLGIILVRGTMVLAAFQILYLFFFIHTFPNDYLPLSSKVMKAVTAAVLIVSLIAMSPFMFVAIQEKTATPGPGIVTFLLYAIVLMGNGLFTLVKKLRHSKGTLHQQLKFLTWGIVSSFTLIALMNLGVVLLSRSIQLVNLTPLYSFLLIGFVAYAIATQHLFDIRVFISRAIIYSLLVSFSLALYGLSVYLITSLVGTETQEGLLLASLITAGALAFSFEPLQRWNAEKTDSWLFKKEYEQQEVTKKLSGRLSGALGLDEGLDVVMHTLAETLHLNHAVTYVFQTGDLGKQVVKRSRQIGYSDPRTLELSDKDFMVDYFTTHPETILVPNLEDQLKQEEHLITEGAVDKNRLSARELQEHAVRKVIAEKLENLDVAVAIPLQLRPNNTEVT
jgi:hypothetical protein